MRIISYACIFLFLPFVAIGETIDELKVKAQAGDGEAQHALAFAYYLGKDYSGKSVEKNNTKAFELWLQAAENGYIYAQERLAYEYKEGFVVQKNLEKADFWSSKAFNQNLIKAKNGELEFQCNLAKNYLYGQGVKKDSKEALYWFRSAAEKGNIEAQAMLGSLYSINSFMLGDSLLKNPKEAQKWLHAAGEAGSLQAQRTLGVLYSYGHFGFDENIEAAVYWHKKAAEQGDQDSQDTLKILTSPIASDKNTRENLLEAQSTVYMTQEEFDALIAAQHKQNTPQKLALLIANSKYSQFGGLANTDSDAQKLAKVLNSLGFQVSILKNASKEEMLDALKDFEAKVRGTNAIAFFHYGGHGVQVEGKNYLIPADAEIPDERRVSTRAVDLDEVIAVLDSAKPKASVLVVDACRHNPLPATATRSATRGLAVVGRKPKNSVIIYAAEAGNEAFDGLFTPILAENLQEHSNKSLNQIMQKVRAEVFERSKGAQTPGEYNQLFEELYFSKTQENATREIN